MIILFDLVEVSLHWIDLLTTFQANKNLGLAPSGTGFPFSAFARTDFVTSKIADIETETLLFSQSDLQDFIHMLHWDKVDLFPGVERKVDKVLLVQIRNDNIFDFVSEGGKGFFL